MLSGWKDIVMWETSIIHTFFSASASAWHGLSRPLAQGRASSSWSAPYTWQVPHQVSLSSHRLCLPSYLSARKRKTTTGTENVCESQNGLHLHPTHPNLLPVPQETGFFAGAHTHTKLKRETGLTRSVASSTVGPGVLSFFTPKTRFIATNRTSSTTTVHTNSICHKKTTFQLQPPGTNDSLETKNIPRDPVYCRWHTTQEMPKWVSSQARAIRVNGDWASERAVCAKLSSTSLKQQRRRGRHGFRFEGTTLSQKTFSPLLVLTYSSI